jgi:RNA polymerase sigma-70 factor (ECF subfamily)
MLGSGEARDAELVAAAGLGSQSAFREIVARHQQAVRSFLRRALPWPAEAADADDLAQETFLAAWTGLWRYRREASLRSWLCAIAWKKAQTFVRSRGRERRRHAALGAPDAPAAEGPDPGFSLDAARALAALPDDQRAAVALCLGAGFSHGEAALALRLPLGTIKSHVERGRAKLLASLGGPD